MVTRGSRHDHGPGAAVTAAGLAVGLCLVGALAGCASDDPGGQTDPTSQTTSPDSGTTAPPSPSQTPTVAPADGPWLATDYVRIRMPKGTEIEDNFDFDSIKQATLPGRGGFVHLSVYDGSDLASIDQAARFTKKDSEQRLRIQADLQREDDVVLGDEAVGFHLAGEEPINTVDVVGTLRGGARYVATFFIDDRVSPQKRQQILDSVLPTWEFVAP